MLLFLQAISGQTHLKLKAENLHHPKSRRAMPRSPTSSHTQRPSSRKPDRILVSGANMNNHPARLAAAARIATVSNCLVFVQCSAYLSPSNSNQFQTLQQPFQHPKGKQHANLNIPRPYSRNSTWFEPNAAERRRRLEEPTLSCLCPCGDGTWALGWNPFVIG